jgi:PAS domain S-box-containing protein
MDMHLIVPACALAVQVVSVFFTIRLWRHTGNRTIATLLFFIVSLMAFRRAISLLRFFTDGEMRVDLAAESTAVTVSCLILFSIIYIERLVSRERAGQEALVSAETRYRTLFNQSPDGVLLIDAQGTIVDFNDETCRQLGYMREEFRNLRIADLDAVESPEQIKTRFEKVAREGKAEFEVKHKTKSGEVRDVLVITQTLYLGGQMFHHTIWRDITERKRTEERLIRSEERLRLAIAANRQGWYDLNMETGEITASEEYARILGYEPEEFSTNLRDWMKELHPEDRAVVVKSLQQATETGEVRVLEFRRRTKTGELKWLHSTGKVVGFDAEQKPVRLIGTLTDISEQKQAERALAESEANYRNLFDSSTDGIFILSLDGNFIDANRTAYERLGYTREEFLALNISRLDHPDYSKDVPERIRQIRERGVAVFESGHLRKDGSTMPVEVNSRILEYKGRQVFFSVVRDIAERKRAEEALRESERRYRTLFDQSPDGILLLGMDGKILEFNASAHRDLGYTREEFAQLRVSDLDPFEGPEEVQARMQSMLRDGKASFYVKHRTKAGALRDVHVIVHIIELSGNPVGHAIWHDITDIKKMRDALEEKTAEQNAILENAVVGIAFLKDRRFIWINPKMEQMFGYQRDEVSGLTTQMLYPSYEEYEQFGTDAYPLLAKGETSSVERRMRRKDGSVFWCSLSGKSVATDSLGQGSIWILQDVTERKQAEEALKQSEQFIRGILDTVDEGFIVIDREYRILTANKAYCEQAGADCDSIIGKSCYEVSHLTVRPCFEEGEECAPRRVFDTGKPCSALHKHRDAKGRIMFVETKAFPIRDSSGTVTSVIETINNITEKHLLEEERLKTQKLESIGTLAGGIAHDFNNLLQGIFGYLSMAKMSLGDKEKARTLLEQAEKALHQSVNLTTQLLTFSKGGKPVMRTIALQPVIENAVKFALSGSRSTYELRMAPDLWQVEADEGQLGQVIQNIVLNADQAMPLGGSVVLRAGNLAASDSLLPQELSGRDAVLISIQDSGVGISEQYLSKIFDPYFTTKEKGSGLGLATTYSIVRNHGGLIRVQSAVDAGTTFFLYLPASGKNAEVSANPMMQLRQRTGRVLVLDDEEVIRMVSAEMLGALGHEVAFADKGETAIEAYRAARDENRPFDVVILDLTIRGGMGGAETLQRLLKIDPGVKAVVSSGYSDDAIAAGYQEQGFKAFLKKPYNVDELQKVLDRLLNA